MRSSSYDQVSEKQFYIGSQLRNSLFFRSDWTNYFSVCKSFYDEDADFSGLKILHVDDNLTFSFIMKEYFKMSGGEYFFCSSGIDALSYIENGNFDIILMDKEMPVLDGVETTKLIRELNNYEKAQIPIIALTSDLSEEALHAFRNAGANGFIPKPFKFADINEMIQTVLKTSEKVLA